MCTCTLYNNFCIFHVCHPSTFSSKIVSRSSAARSKSSAFAASFISISSVAINLSSSLSSISYLLSLLLQYVSSSSAACVARIISGIFLMNCFRCNAMFFIVRFLNCTTTLCFINRLFH